MHSEAVGGFGGFGARFRPGALQPRAWAAESRKAPRPHRTGRRAPPWPLNRPLVGTHTAASSFPALGRSQSERSEVAPQTPATRHASRGPSVRPDFGDEELTSEGSEPCLAMAANLCGVSDKHASGRSF